MRGESAMLEPGGGKKPKNNRACEWRTLPWLFGYEVSEFGDVRATQDHHTHPKAGEFVAGFMKGGYRRYKLNQRLRWAHRLVCEAFNGPAPSERHEVAHNDGDRLNNHFSNLRWATRQDNHLDRQAHGTDAVGERNGRAKLTWGQVKEIRARRTGAYGETASLAREYGVSWTAMADIMNGSHWRG